MAPPIGPTADLERVIEQLEQEAESREALFGELGHELRNHASSIKMALSLLDPAAPDLAERQRFRTAALRHAAELERAIDGVVDLARLGRGDARLLEEPVELRRVLESAVAAIRDELSEVGLRVHVEVEPGPFPLEGDPVRLEQALLRAVSELAGRTATESSLSVSLARERSANGGEEATVRLRADGTARSAREAGLLFVRSVVELHGGALELPDAGRELLLRLPLAPGTTTSEPPAVQPAQTAATSRRRALVIEDSEDQRVMIRAALEQLGHEVRLAKDGIEGVARVLELRPEVVFVDVGLPGLDGFSVARQIRAAGGKQPILVALTGYSGPLVRRKLDAARFDISLTKPLTIEMLSTVMRAAPLLKPSR